jgi:hypothetical protein
VAATRSRRGRGQPAQGGPPCAPGDAQHRHRRAAWGQVALAPGHTVEVDAARFEQLAAAALAGDDTAACADAASAYGGDLLPGSPYEAWADAARTRLHERHLALLRAGAQWEWLAETDPTDEPAHRELMRRELAAGRRAAAIRWYSHLRTALQHTLDITPDRDTQALYDECVDGLRHAGPAFIGRQMELARAAAWLGAPVDERAGGLVVRGPAGIGKSAFLREIGTLARERGWTVVSVDAVEAGSAYAVFAAVVERLLRRRRSLLDAIGAPARSVLATLTPLAAPAALLSLPLGRHQVVGALRRLLLALSGGAPVLLHVDDAHRVDDADADVLMHLVATGRPVCVALATRALPEDARLARVLSRLAASRHVEPIDLDAMSDAEAADLVAHASSRSPAATVVERIVQLAQGSPFAALELARSLAADPSARVPPSAREAITARLCEVDDATMALLKRLALTGDEFESSVVVALAPGAEAEACTGLDRALAASVLVVSDGRYRFRHDLVRQALVELIPPRQRRKVHRDAARRLAQLDAPPALVARHWMAGGSLAEAVPWLLAAAQDAMRLGAFRDALRSLESLLACQRRPRRGAAAARRGAGCPRRAGRRARLPHCCRCRR